MKSSLGSYDEIPADTVRASAVAGAFYPGRADQLRKVVESLLEQAGLPDSSPDKLIAGISPHAGYIYSGRVAAHLYKLLQRQKPETFAIIAPSHFEHFPFISLFTGAGYSTPLGNIPVARILARELVASHESFVAAWNGHRSHGVRAEHALEVQLPFLQLVAPSCELLPIVMGDQSWTMCEILAEELAKLAARTSLFIIASSDLSHYHPYEEAVEIDQRFIAELNSQRAKDLHAVLQRRDCEACGAGPIVAAALAAKNLGANSVSVLLYENSGDVSGEFESVVGYVAAVLGRAN